MHPPWRSVEGRRSPSHRPTMEIPVSGATKAPTRRSAEARRSTSHRPTREKPGGGGAGAYTAPKVRRGPQEPLLPANDGNTQVGCVLKRPPEGRSRVAGAPRTCLRGNHRASSGTDSSVLQDKFWGSCHSLGYSLYNGIKIEALKTYLDLLNSTYYR